MGQSSFSWNLPVSIVASLLMCVLFINVDFLSATPLTQNEVPEVAALSKRDVYMSNPRNCPDAYLLTRKRFVENLMDRGYVVPGRDVEPSRKRSVFNAGQVLDSSLYSHKDWLKNHMLDRSRRHSTRSSNMNRQPW